MFRFTIRDVLWLTVWRQWRPRRRVDHHPTPNCYSRGVAGPAAFLCADHSCLANSWHAIDKDNDLTGQGLLAQEVTGVGAEVVPG